MKRLEDLGAKKLTRDQQKKVAGGIQVTCLCPNNGTAFLCVGSLDNCIHSAMAVCGGGSVACAIK